MPAITEESFLKDVQDHSCTILKDEGLYRHLRFQRSETRMMSFDILTWPGHLCYTGDMGSFVFARVQDMFEFFRRSRKDKRYPIDFRYWAEKCISQDRDGLTEFNPERFIEVVNEFLDNHEAGESIRAIVKDKVLSAAHDGRHAALQAAMDFNERGFTFEGLWEYSLNKYTHRFTWCCYGIAWGIEQYDLTKLNQEAVLA